jgi:T5SS/PEP-CTERM-associated repeat protein
MHISNTLNVGVAPSVRAGLDVIGCTINVGDVNIGTADNADALVTLRDGAVLDPIGYVTVGGGPGAQAQLFLISGSTLKLDEGENLTVTGPNSGVTTEALSIGTTNNGGGVMTISQGAKLTVNGDLDILDSELLIQDSDSVVTVAGSAQFSTGSRVTISGGGRLLPSEAFNEGGAFLINTTGLTENDTGVQVAGAGSWLRAGAQEIAIGSLSNGEVEILDGAELLTLGDIVIGGVSNETYGDLLVRGEGSIAFANSIQLFSAGDALSVLEVDAGAEVTLGNDVHANGSRVIISGAGSTLEMDNQFLIRGGADATLEVSDGGSLIVAAELEDVGVDGTTLIFDSIDPASIPQGGVLLGGTSVTNDSRIRTLGNIKIGHESDGYVLVDLSSELVTLNDVYLGNGENETSGYLVVDEGSEFGANRVVVGADEGGSGLLRVSDSAEAFVFAVLDVRGNGVVQTELGGPLSSASLRTITTGRWRIMSSSATAAS